MPGTLSVEEAFAFCEARVRAVSYAGLRVVIDWSAPEDVDLHMVHPSTGGDLSKASSWFINPWDCWFENPHPIWDGGGREDDPKLVRDDQVDEVVEAIQRSARTGEVGDGKIFLTRIDDAVRIRTGERGEAAL